MTYDMINTLARRARYKNIEETSNIKYCHFVFQGFRIEALEETDNHYHIICICKGGSPKSTNSLENYNNQIIYMRDNLSERIFNNDKYGKFMKSLQSYTRNHSKWFTKDKWGIK